MAATPRPSGEPPAALHESLHHIYESLVALGTKSDIFCLDGVVHIATLARLLRLCL